jgi:hypothetical protein
MEVGQLLELPAWYLRLAAMSKAPTAKTALTLFCHAAHIFPAQLFFFLTMWHSPEGGWSAEEWLVFFDERAGVAEFDGGLPRPQAEVHAFACCVAEWLNQHPVGSAKPPDFPNCGKNGGAGGGFGLDQPNGSGLRDSADRS